MVFTRKLQAEAGGSYGWRLLLFGEVGRLYGWFAVVDKKKPTAGMTDKATVVCSFPLFANFTMNKNEEKAF